WNDVSSCRRRGGVLGSRGWIPGRSVAGAAVQEPRLRGRASATGSHLRRRLVNPRLPCWLDAGTGGRPGIAHLLDYTLLRPEATRDDVLRLCDEAAAASTCAVCVNGAWVSTCVERLRGTGIRVAAVVGFPLGAGGSATK